MDRARFRRRRRRTALIMRSDTEKRTSTNDDERCKNTGPLRFLLRFRWNARVRRPHRHHRCEKDETRVTHPPLPTSVLLLLRFVVCACGVCVCIAGPAAAMTMTGTNKPPP